MTLEELTGLIISMVYRPDFGFTLNLNGCFSHAPGKQNQADLITNCCDALAHLEFQPFSDQDHPSFVALFHRKLGLRKH